MHSINVLVTGAGGFLGRYFVAVLRDVGHRVRALVRPATDINPFNWSSDIKVFRADLCEVDNLVDAFRGIDVLVHLAAHLRGDDKTRISATLTGTERLLNAMSVSTTKRLVLASSFSVYNYRELCGTLDEEAPIEAVDLLQRDGYAVAKVNQENMARHFAQQHAWDLTVLRPGSIWGPGHLEPPNIGQRLGPLYFIIAPRATLPLSYVENCAEAFARAATVTASQTFNVVDDELVTAWNFAGEYLRRTRQSAIRVPVPYDLGLLAGQLASAVQRTIFLGKLSLPNILRPRCFEARFKPLRNSSAAVRQALKWLPRFTFDQAWNRVLRQLFSYSSKISHV